MGTEWLAVLDALQHAAGTLSPLWAIVVGAAIFALRKGWIPLPEFLKGKPKVDPVDPVDPLPLPDEDDLSADINGDGVIQPWEDLVDRLKKRLKERFAERVVDGEDEEDVFHDLATKLKE